MFLFDRFLVFSESSIEFPFGLPDVEFIAIFARNEINYTTRTIFWKGIFRLGKKVANGLVWLKGDFNTTIIFLNLPKDWEI